MLHVDLCNAIKAVERHHDDDHAVAREVCAVAQHDVIHVADAEAVLNAGAEKISVNSPALLDPALIDRLAARFGSQCVVVGIDSQTTEEGFSVYQFTGDPTRTRDTRRDTLQWVREVQDRGACEIVLNCMALTRRTFGRTELLNPP